jgi:mono/diheme cytochrome c family protein
MKRFLEILIVVGVLSMTLSTLAQESKDVPRVYMAEQATAGEREVQNNAFGRCSDCHANGLAGRSGDPNELPPLSSLPEDTQTMVGNYGGKVPQLAGPKFLQRWGTRSTKDLSAEMRDRFSGPLSEETRLNIMAYILKLNGALPGSQPLTLSTDVPINRLAK